MFQILSLNWHHSEWNIFPATLNKHSIGADGAGMQRNFGIILEIIGNFDRWLFQEARGQLSNGKQGVDRYSSTSESAEEF